MKRRALSAAGAAAAVMPVARMSFAQTTPDADMQAILMDGNFALEVAEQEAVARASGAKDLAAQMQGHEQLRAISNRLG